MITSGESDRDGAARGAARWMLALEEAPDDAALRGRFEAWLHADPVHAEAWADISDIEAMMGRMEPAHASHWQPPTAKHGLSAASSRRNIAVGASAALAACLALVFVLPMAKLWLEADVATASAETRDLSLADGSVVTLGPDSAIAVDMGADERRIRLLKGEAFFEVAPNPSRPFVVAAGEIRTVVLGTAFDIRLEVAGAAVAVRHGRVRVESGGTGQMSSDVLEAGHWMRVAWDGNIGRGSLPPEEVAAWRDHRIIARSQPLTEIIESLRPFFAGRIVLADRALGHRRVSGVYNTDDPIEALRAVVAAHGGVVRQISPWFVVVSGD